MWANFRRREIRRDAGRLCEVLETRRGEIQSPNVRRHLKPDLSIVVVAYNIPRELPRTLYSLSSRYQRHINSDDYEVIIVDNGSVPPVDPDPLRDLVGNFRLIRIDEASPSPAAAVNRGIAEAQGEIIAVMIDGARVVTPGLLHFGRHAARLYERAVVASLGWYLGYDYQRNAMEAGYDQAAEDALLESIGWREDGYRLFEIATMDESSVDGWFAPISESNALFLRRDTWDLLGGMDEQFDLPGGGLVNLDTFHRAVDLSDAELVLMLGEGTFHQLHDGVATNVSAETMNINWTKWADQYERIRGRPYDVPLRRHLPTYIGTLPRAALARLARAALFPVSNHPPALGFEFSRELWSLAPAAPPADPTIAALVELAQKKFRAGYYVAAGEVSRLIRKRAPNEKESQRLLSLVAAWLPPQGLPPQNSAVEYYLALAEAHLLLGEAELATTNYQAALAIDPDLVQGHICQQEVGTAAADFQRLRSELRRVESE